MFIPPSYSQSLVVPQILAEINSFYLILTVDKYQSGRVTNYNKRIHSFCANKHFFLNAKSN